MTQVHRCRFLGYAPQAIHCIAASTGAGPLRLAVSRSDASIEIWNVAAGFYLEATLPGGGQTSVEALAWSGSRLFSAGLYADVTEWDIDAAQPKVQADSLGGAVWCLAVSHANDRLAVGCEDGGVRLLSLTEAGLPMASRFEVQDARILSLAWSPNDDMVVTGDANSTIRVFHAKSGRPLSRMVLDAGTKEKTLVWSVAFLSGMTVASSDSLGRVQVWNGKTGTLESSLETHLADIHAMVATEQAIYASGIDSKVVKLVRHPDKPHEWLVSGVRRDHMRDVRAMVLLPDGRLVSGGVDTQLVINTESDTGFAAASTKRVLAFPQHDVVSLASDVRLLAFRQQSTLQIWRLVPALDQTTELERPQTPTLELEVHAPGQRHIVASTISSDGQLLAFSSPVIGTRILRLDADGHRLQPSRIPGTKAIGLARDLLFTPNHAALLARVSRRIVKIFGVEDFKVTGQLELPAKVSDDSRAESGVDGYNTALTVSNDAQWVAVVTGSRLDIFSLDSLQWAWSWQMPQPISAAAFLHYQSYLAVVDTANKLSVLDVESHSVAPWSLKTDELGLPRQFLHKQEKIYGLRTDAHHPQRLILQDTRGIYVVDTDKEPPKADINLKSNKAQDTKNSSWRFVRQYGPLLYASSLGPQELVVVERPLQAIEDALPLPLERRRYGV